ncbi:MAG: hypothetical protein IT347_03265 [Candidatus Eisenbacteria bacterium]|nr:hypothetical protein [Candidatus Eisenbacteria bacterium]
MNESREERRLLELAALPAEDPRRIEAARDPRTRAWLLEHDAFLEIHPLDPQDEGEVSRVAASALARARAEAAHTHGAVLELPRAARRREGGLPRWALAAAGVAIVAGAAVVVPRLLVQGPGNLRSLSPESSAGAFVSRAASRDAQGRVVLAWRPAAGATAYRVELLSGLDAVATREVPQGDSLVLDPASLPAGPLLWRVLALRDGAVVATTAPRELPR